MSHRHLSSGANLKVVHFVLYNKTDYLLYFCEEEDGVWQKGDSISAKLAVLFKDNHFTGPKE